MGEEGRPARVMNRFPGSAQSETNSLWLGREAPPVGGGEEGPVREVCHQLLTGCFLRQVSAIEGLAIAAVASGAQSVISTDPQSIPSALSASDTECLGGTIAGSSRAARPV